MAERVALELAYSPLNILWHLHDEHFELGDTLVKQLMLLQNEVCAIVIEILGDKTNPAEIMEAMVELTDYLSANGSNKGWDKHNPHPGYDHSRDTVSKFGDILPMPSLLWKFPVVLVANHSKQDRPEDIVKRFVDETRARLTVSDFQGGSLFLSPSTTASQLSVCFHS